jgi:cytochrome c biogenesis protein
MMKAKLPGSADARARGVDMSLVWKFFASVKLAIVLLILLAAASIIGTLIPQGLPEAVYAGRYGQLSGLLMALQLTKLYHSGWYLTLLFFFAVNTTVCTVTRLPAKWRRAFRATVELDPAGLQALKVRSRFGKNGTAEEVRTRLEGLLAARRYRVKRQTQGKRLCILAQKRRSGHLGSDAVHLGLLVIIVGGIVTGLGGFRTQLNLSEGQTAKILRAPFEVRLDRFETEYYPQGMVKAWKSTVTILEGGTGVLSRTIQVNKPLAYKGFNFYQTSFGSSWADPTLEITIKKKSDSAFARTVRLTVGEKAAVDDKDVSQISVQRFVPDFVIGEGSQVESRSQEPQNPAAQVDGWKGGEKVFSGWIFANYPDFEQMHAGQPTDLSFGLKSFRGSEYSVLEAAQDPGVGLIWVGCLLVTAGFFLAFYWPPREIRAVLEERGERTEITAGGFASKGRESFQAEFEDIMNSLRGSS